MGRRKYMRLNRYVLPASMLFILIPALLFAQGKRPQVLVFGDGIDAYAAAIQSAKSKLNTVWIWESVNPADGLLKGISPQPGNITSHHNLDAGVWADLLATSMGNNQRSDSLASLVKRRINPQLILNAMEEELVAYPHLLVIRGGQIQSAKKRRRNWRIQLTDRRQFTIHTVVDATDNGQIGKLAGLPDWKERTTLTEEYFDSTVFLPLARTGVAVSDVNHSHPYTIPLGTLIPAGNHNLFYTKNTKIAPAHAVDAWNTLPLLAHIGQAVGAAAGYVAFYRTTSDKIEVRQIQGELLQYGGRLLPFQDILQEDPHFGAIQRIGATGLLRPKISDGGKKRYLFEPDSTVSTAELRPTLNQLFSRSAVWFADHQSNQLTLAELMSLIKYIGHRGNELEALIEKNWERQFKFPGNYDPSMIVSRRHVAVLLDAYVKPFDVRVDLSGRITR